MCHGNSQQQAVLVVQQATAHAIAYTNSPGTSIGKVADSGTGGPLRTMPFANSS
jgi:hypothetical protein